MLGLQPANNLNALSIGRHAFETFSKEGREIKDLALAGYTNTCTIQTLYEDLWLRATPMFPSVTSCCCGLQRGYEESK